MIHDAPKNMALKVLCYEGAERTIFVNSQYCAKINPQISLIERKLGSGTWVPKGWEILVQAISLHTSTGQDYKLIH